MPEIFPNKWIEKLTTILPETSPRTSSEIAKFLKSKDKLNDLTEHLQTGILNRTLNSNILAWICKVRNDLTSKLFDANLPSAIINDIEREQLEDNSRKQNKLKEVLMDDPDLIKNLLEKCNLGQVKTFARRLLSTSSFDDLSRKSLLARIIKIYPEIQQIVSGSEQLNKSNEEKSKNEKITVSWESLDEKKKEFDELVNKKIPANSKEISVARSYGDLRENFEFKAAKEMQSVLLKRKDEMEQELENAQGTDFKNATTEKVSIGTIVTISQKNDTNDKKVTILGAWDSIPEENIISYLSQTGQTLLNKKVGDTIKLENWDGDDSSQSVEIKKIEKYIS